jgi:hypothetical protein
VLDEVCFTSDPRPEAHGRMSPSPVVVRWTDQRVQRGFRRINADAHTKRRTDQHGHIDSDAGSDTYTHFSINGDRHIDDHGHAHDDAHTDARVTAARVTAACEDAARAGIRCVLRAGGLRTAPVRDAY